MENGFKYETGNHHKDYVQCRTDGVQFWMEIGDESDLALVRLTRSDLDAIIEKLIALRDGVGQ